MVPPDDPVPGGLVRYKIADELKKEDRNIQHPKYLKNEIIRLCMQSSFDYKGIDWKHLYFRERNAYSVNQRFDRKKGPFWSLEYRRIGNEGGGWRAILRLLKL